MTEQPKEIQVTLEELMKLEYFVSDFSILPRQPIHSVLSGKHASKLRGRGLDFSEVRKYVFGDDIRNIDWKVTARTKQTHTKVFNEEKERPCYIIVDQSSSMFFASAGQMKSVIAAQVAAIGAFKVLKAGDRVGGLVFDDHDFESIKPHRSRLNLLHYLKTVVAKNEKLVNRKEMINNREMIDKVLFNARNIISHDYVVIIISDFLNISEQGLQHISAIARHNDVIAVKIQDQMEQNLPPVKMAVSDGDGQIMIKPKQKVLESYRTIAQIEDHKIQEFFMQYKIPTMKLNTIDPLIQQIKEIFHK